MLGPIKVQNFKSIRSVEFEAKRVNLFIGEPNTGKSNILEALAFFSIGALRSFRSLFRFRVIADLFFDQKVTEGIYVGAGDLKLDFRLDGSSYRGQFQRAGGSAGSFQMNHQGAPSSLLEVNTPVRYYQFRSLDAFQNPKAGLLNPPAGDNLAAVLYSNEPLRKRIGELIRSKGYRLQLKPTDNELLIAKDVDDELYSFPWTSVSETLRRMAFLMAALETNKDATLLFDEPEANTFPFYTKYFAERIALDESNQYFITTHNPYLLSSVTEKTPAKDLAVFVTRMERFETKLKQIPQSKIPELIELNADAFFNLDRLVDE